MAKFFSRQSADSLEPLKVLFVNVNEDDTSFLTKDVPIKVAHASTKSGVETRLAQEEYDALVIDLADPGAETISQVRQSHDTPVLLLADSGELPRAIRIIKEGADGFLLRGVSNPASLIELTKSVNRCSELNH